jgi:hypothetical protein
VVELPRGTVTFLFTHLEGSTRLLHELGADEYANRLDGRKKPVSHGENALASSRALGGLRPAQATIGGPAPPLLECLEVGDERLQPPRLDDPAPMGHADDRRPSDHATAANHIDDLLVRVELGPEGKP